MKNILSLLLITSFLVITSCKTKDRYIDYSEKAQLENALLWKIEGEGLTEPSYLYGTIHMIEAEDYFLPTGTLTAMEETDKMVFEINMNEMTDMSSLMSIMGKAFMKDNQTLSDLLNDEDYAVVEDHFKKIGLPLMMLERMKPMFLSVFAYGDMDPKGMQNGSVKSYEMEFFEMANNTGKEVDGLETIEFQMGIFDEIPYKDQAKILVETIKSSSEGSDQFAEMVRMYKDQDITHMIKMMDDDKSMSEHEDVLLVKRNRAWIPLMGKMMKKQPTFFAVGAGHLAGVDGVIKLLRKEGYRVSPVSNKAK